MFEQDQIARWIIGLKAADEVNERTMKLIESAQLAWPRVVAVTRREMSNQQFSTTEIASMTLEIWETVLRSVSRTWLQRPAKAEQIGNLENYLIGAFHHRLNRYLKQRRRRDMILEFLPPSELASLGEAASIDEGCALRIQRAIQQEQIYAAMDERIREAVMARACGLSWAEIAKIFQIEKQRLMMRVQYSIRKVREELTERRSVKKRQERL